MSTQSRDPTLKCMRLVSFGESFLIEVSRNDPNWVSYTLDTLEAVGCVTLMSYARTFSHDSSLRLLAWLCFSRPADLSLWPGSQSINGETQNTCSQAQFHSNMTDLRGTFHICKKSAADICFCHFHNLLLPQKWNCQDELGQYPACVMAPYFTSARTGPPGSRDHLAMM